MEKVNHPNHYGGKESVYEAIKVIEAWNLDFSLGNVIKYISRAGKKSDNVMEDLEKAKWYLERAISNCAAIEKDLVISTDDIDKRYNKGDIVISLSNGKEYAYSGSCRIVNDVNLTVWDNECNHLCLHRNGIFAEKITLSNINHSLQLNNNQ